MKKVNLNELQFPCTVKAVLHNKEKRQALLYCEEPDWFVIAINLYKEEGSTWVQDSIPGEDFCTYYEPTHMEKMLMDKIVWYYKAELDAEQEMYNKKTSGWWYKFTMKIAKRLLYAANTSRTWKMHNFLESLAFKFNRDILPF